MIDGIVNIGCPDLALRGEIWRTASEPRILRRRLHASARSPGGILDFAAISDAWLVSRSDRHRAAGVLERSRMGIGATQVAVQETGAHHRRQHCRRTSRVGIPWQHWLRRRHCYTDGIDPDEDGDGHGAASNIDGYGRGGSPSPPPGSHVVSADRRAASSATGRAPDASDPVERVLRELRGGACRRRGAPARW
jgi:hypothetical protein